MADRKQDPLLPPGVVAVMCGVTVHTVARWARDGKLTAERTLGGHRRYRESEVRALLRRDRQDIPEAVVA
ncbi:helix-turn-helix domain-containing protein [Nonomuraea sp. 3-1Str]|uniref:helix-turn-helix domain-containing protein n=1 Tax=Nonomuraea sp. 3-1Str TaxID=2929801 RepID=UPI00286FC178|nr:helix-turn-helix domain-containing protein [Nonomuraea sp. 3-1Str]